MFFDHLVAGWGTSGGLARMDGGAGAGGTRAASAALDREGMRVCACVSESACAGGVRWGYKR